MTTLPTLAEYEAQSVAFEKRWLGESIYFNRRFGAQCVQVFKKYEQDQGAPIGKAGTAHELPESLGEYTPAWAADFNLRYRKSPPIKWGDPLPRGSWIIWRDYPGNSYGHIGRFVEWVEGGKVKIFNQWRRDNKWETTINEETGKKEIELVKLGTAKYSIMSCDHIKAVMIPNLRENAPPPAVPPVITVAPPKTKTPASPEPSFSRMATAESGGGRPPKISNRVSKIIDKGERWGKGFLLSFFGVQGYEGQFGEVERHFDWLGKHAQYVEIGIIVVLFLAILLFSLRAYRAVKRNEDPGKISLWVFNKLKGTARMAYKKQIGDTELYDKITAKL